MLPFLPGCLDGLARKTGAVQRKRGVRSASDLLKMLFLYACSNISFCILATGAYALGISDISDTAWRKHFSKSSSFLYEILASLYYYHFFQKQVYWLLEKMYSWRMPLQSARMGKRRNIINNNSLPLYPLLLHNLITPFFKEMPCSNRWFQFI